jgi:hypothetical protein
MKNFKIKILTTMKTIILVSVCITSTSQASVIWCLNGVCGNINDIVNPQPQPTPITFNTNCKLSGSLAIDTLGGKWESTNFNFSTTKWSPESCRTSLEDKLVKHCKDKVLEMQVPFSTYRVEQLSATGSYKYSNGISIGFNAFGKGSICENLFITY